LVGTLEVILMEMTVLELGNSKIQIISVWQKLRLCSGRCQWIWWKHDAYIYQYNMATNWKWLWS
jgi:hypothetical protein